MSWARRAGRVDRVRARRGREPGRVERGEWVRVVRGVASCASRAYEALPCTPSLYRVRARLNQKAISAAGVSAPRKFRVASCSSYTSVRSECERAR
jgi:hypothetical protein